MGGCTALHCFESKSTQKSNNAYPTTHQNQLPVHLAQLARGEHHLIFPLLPILATPIPPILLHGVVGVVEAARGGELLFCRVVFWGMGGLFVG